MPSARCPKNHEGGTAHFWVPNGERKDKYEAVYEPGFWRYCNRCGEVDRETPLCHGRVVDRSMRITRWSTCAKVATLEHKGVPYCRTHHPPTVQAKQDARNLKSEARYRASIRKDAGGWYGDQVRGHLAQLAEWAEKNGDLVDADEWLGIIIRSASELRKKLD